MGVIKSWGGAGLTSGTTITTGTNGTGDTAFSSVTGTACKVANDGIRTPCLGVDDGTGLAYGQWTISALGNWSLKLMVKVTTAASGLIFASTSDASSNKVTGFDFTASGQLRLSTNPSGTNTNFQVFAAAFPTGSWTRIEYAETAAGAWTCAYYAGDSSTPIASASGTKATAQTMASVRVGRIAAAVASSGLKLDDIAVADETALDTPTLTSTGGTPASSALATDRTETVTWSAVAGATGYRALTAASGSTDYTIVNETVTSPYTFTGLPGGPCRVAIQAKG